MHSTEQPDICPKKELAVWASLSRTSVKIVVVGFIIVVIAFVGMIWQTHREMSDVPMDIDVVIEHNVFAWSMVGSFGIFCILLGASIRWLAKRERSNASRKFIKSKQNTIA